MGRRRYLFSEQKVQRYIREGRGRGEGKDYKPWLKIQDVPSQGRSHRLFGNPTRRVHHFLSDGEWKCFLHFEADEQTRDIREQYPMPRLETARMAFRLGLEHPVTTDGTPGVMTIDFLVTRLCAGQWTRVPYTFKYDFTELNSREWELLEIQRAYWRDRGCELQLIDHMFFDDRLVRCYDAYRAFYDLDGLEVARGAGFISSIAHELVCAVSLARDTTLSGACADIDRRVGASQSDAFTVARHLLARRVLATDLFDATPLEHRPLAAFRLQGR